MSVTWLETRPVPVDQLTRFPGNARRGDVKAIRESIRRTGQYRAIVVRKTGDQMIILAGNHTFEAISSEGSDSVRCEIIECSDAEALRINLADNRLAEIGEYDNEDLASLLAGLDGDLDGTGWTAEDIDLLLDPEAGSSKSYKINVPLAEEFIVPPFDVLNAQTSRWQDRKREWLDLGIESWRGRSAGLAHTNEKFTSTMGINPATNTSVFDPVLCEVAYRWFSGPGHAVLDPFAGGSVRGLMAGMLGRGYLGNDLSPEQVADNREQEEDFHNRGLIKEFRPVWTVGDSREWVKTLPEDSADMILTCPPYYDLESYSNGPGDLSRMRYEEFNEIYTEILSGASAALRENRFAVIVTGNVRDGKGRIRDLRQVTVSAMESAGLTYVQDAVLMTMIASASRRARAPFLSKRGITRIHQDVSVFCKGDRGRAAEAAGQVEVYVPDEDDL